MNVILDSACKSKFTKSLASSSSTSAADQHELDSLHLHSSSPHHQFLHPSLSYFSPMDLRLFASQNAQGLVDQRSHELNNFMNLTSCPMPANNISNNNYASIHEVFGSNGANSSYPLAFAPDFAQSTMKELLGLYGITENLRQGKPRLIFLAFHNQTGNCHLCKLFLSNHLHLQFAYCIHILLLPYVRAVSIYFCCSKSNSQIKVCAFRDLLNARQLTVKESRLNT